MRKTLWLRSAYKIVVDDTIEARNVIATLWINSGSNKTLVLYFRVIIDSLLFLSIYNAHPEPWALLYNITNQSDINVKDLLRHCSKLSKRSAAQDYRLKKCFLG